jgi:hypothetical protein
VLNASCNSSQERSGEGGLQAVLLLALTISAKESNTHNGKADRNKCRTIHSFERSNNLLFSVGPKVFPQMNGIERYAQLVRATVSTASHPPTLQTPSTPHHSLLRTSLRLAHSTSRAGNAWAIPLNCPLGDMLQPGHPEHLQRNRFEMHLAGIRKLCDRPPREVYGAPPQSS